MGCQVSYCQEEYKINTKETFKASKQYYNTNRKTQRIIEKCKRTYSEITIDRNTSDDEESTKKITGEVSISDNKNTWKEQGRVDPSNERGFDLPFVFP